MKKLLCFQFLLFFALAGFVSAQSVDDIIAANQKARGAAKHSTTYIEATMSQMGQEMPVKLWLAGNGDKIRLEQSQNGQQITIVSNGNNCWLSYPGQIQEVPKEQVQMLTQMFDFFVAGPLANYKEDSLTVKSDGTDMVNGATCNIIKAGKGESMLSIYIDAKTNLDVKYEAAAPQTEDSEEDADQTFIVSDWKMFNNVNCPTKIEIKSGDETALTITATKIEFDKKFEDKIFSKPE